jgi:hypothetical protein
MPGVGTGAVHLASISTSPFVNLIAVFALFARRVGP